MDPTCTQINEACAHAFKQIAVSHAILVEQHTATREIIERIDKKVDVLHAVVCGNGDPATSLSFRLIEAEKQLINSSKRRKTATDRAWEITKGLILLGAGFALGYFK